MRRTSLLTYLPDYIAQELAALPSDAWRAVQELRLRVGVPPILTTAAATLELAGAVSQTDIQTSFIRFCDRAVHTHQEELKAGFVTTKDGFRVGVAGTAVVRDSAVTSYRDIQSLCVRIPREVVGCATRWIPHIDTANGMKSVLFCGAPASGKTTVLRDIAATLSWRHSIAVVDERFELSACGLPRCDVLRGCPKAVGMWQAIRTLAPDAVIVDELGDDAEWEAVEACLFAGVAVIASVHAQSKNDLYARAAVCRILENGGFSQTVFLGSRVRKVGTDNEVDRSGVGDRRMHRDGVECRTSTPRTRALVESVGDSA